MKVYIASMFSRREEMEMWAQQMKDAGHEVVSRWVFGGESGLNRTDISLLDFEDINASDIVVSFTSPYGTATKGGGRHVEFGYGLGTGKQLALIGERENVFHHHPNVKVFSTLEQWLNHVEIIK